MLNTRLTCLGKDSSEDSCEREVGERFVRITRLPYNRAIPLLAIVSLY